MRSPVAVRLGAQRPSWHKPPPAPHHDSDGEEAVRLAESVGLVLDDWQAWWLRQALAVRPDGDWASKENVLICARQCGKNGVLAAMELFALDQLAEPLTIHSAHEVPTALNHFRYMLALIDGSYLRKKVAHVSHTNGKESIEFRNGAVLQFRARGRNSGRGLTAGRLVFDEAFKIPAESMGALVPTLRAVPNAQITYASSAPKADSVVLHSLIARGRAGDPSDRLFYAEWGNVQGTSMDDVDAWYRANPALGIRIDESALHDEYRTLVSGGDPDLVAEFSREAVGIGELPNSMGRSVKLPADAWTATGVSDAVARTFADRVFAFDVSLEGGWSSIASAGGTLLAPYVEVFEHAPGTGWLPGRLSELAARHPKVEFVCNGAGPAGAQVRAVLARFADDGILPERLRQLSGVEYRQACGAFYVDVVEGRLKRPAQGQGPLDLAAADATERIVGDAWVWDIRSATAPISPLVAVTLARALLPLAEPPRPVFAY